MIVVTREAFTGSLSFPVAFPSHLLMRGEGNASSYIPGNAARSKLSNVKLEKKLGVAATTRNFNTLKKMVEISRAKA